MENLQLIYNALDRANKVFTLEESAMIFKTFNELSVEFESMKQQVQKSNSQKGTTQGPFPEDMSEVGVKD